MFNYGNTLFGKLHISSSTIFDEHLFLIVIPFVFLIGLYIKRKQLFGFKANTKQFLLTMSGSLLIVLFALNTAETMFQDGVEYTNGLEFVNNLDTFAMLIAGIFLVSRRYGGARMVVPAMIILGLTRLINNPDNTISWLLVISSIISMVVSSLILFLSSKTISIKEFAFASVINIFLLIYTFSTSSSLSIHQSFLQTNIEKNIFYSIFNVVQIRFFMFILFSFIFEAIIWVAIRYMFWKHSEKRVSFLKSISDEFSNERLFTRNSIKVVLETVSEKEDINFEQQNLSDKNVDVVDVLENLEVEIIETPFLIPLSVERILTSKLIRSPSI